MYFIHTNCYLYMTFINSFFNQGIWIELIALQHNRKALTCFSWWNAKMWQFGNIYDYFILRRIPCNHRYYRHSNIQCSHGSMVPSPRFSRKMRDFGQKNNPFSHKGLCCLAQVDGCLSTSEQISIIFTKDFP